MGRPGGQSQFSAVLDRQLRDAGGRFDALHTWLAERIDEELKVDQLAGQVGMSPRNFARAYRQETGRTPAKTIELFRLDAARNLLEETDFSIGDIARRTGFGDSERFRRAMRRNLGLTPQQYRDRFAGVLAQ